VGVTVLVAAKFVAEFPCALVPQESPSLKPGSAADNELALRPVGPGRVVVVHAVVAVSQHTTQRLATDSVDLLGAPAVFAAHRACPVQDGKTGEVTATPGNPARSSRPTRRASRARHSAGTCRLRGIAAQRPAQANTPV